MKRCLLLLLAVIITGCSQANMRGNETVRHYNITINNDAQSLLVVDMPLQVDAVTSEKTDMVADNDPATTTKTPISLAAQGATASTAAQGATQNLSELVSDYKLWNDFRKWKSDNDNSNNPDPEIPPVTPPPEVTPPVTPPNATEPVPGTVIETGEYKGRSDGRPFWNFSKKMSEYPETFILDIPGCYEGTVTNDGDRWQTTNGAYVVKQSDKGGWNTAAIGANECTSETASFKNIDVPVNPPVTSPIDLSKVEWLHTDVSGWPVTGDLQSVSTTSSTISLPYDKAKVWPSVKISDNLLNANPWVFIKQDGKWYAATWEWLRPGQTSKSKSAVAGDHIKQDPLKDWKPVVGETYGFMVSGLARHSQRNAEERTNIVMYKWR